MKALPQLLLALVVAWVCALMLGATPLSLSEVIAALSDSQHEQHFAVYEYRLPRALLACFIGAALALSGTLIQGLIHNPLASPDILSINHGASLAAVLLLSWHTSVPVWALPLAAMVGAGSAFFILMLLCGRRASTLQTALIGVALSALYAAISDYILLTDPLEINTALVWLTGSLWGRSWPFVSLAVPLLILLLPLSLFFAKDLDLISLGEPKALTLGVHLQRTRWLMLSLAVLLAAIAVAVAGPISFLGLVAPHLARKWVGGRHQVLLPTAMLLGALILQISDIAVRIIDPPMELPAGIFTALIGAPYFFYLLRRNVS